MTGGELTAAQIRPLLRELGRRLQAVGAHGDVKLVGGPPSSSTSPAPPTP
jgi:hypothetical protein